MADIDLRHHCYVPRTARLLAALGGPEIDRDVVISLRHNVIRRFPGDRFEGAIDAPDGRLDGPGELPLWIARPRSERLVPGADWIAIHVGFRGTINGDGYWNTLYGFRVPRRGWEAGLWVVDLWCFDMPISFALHAEDESSQVELNRKASVEWESAENLGLDDALRLLTPDEDVE
jgi:hypothetical protein